MEVTTLNQLSLMSGAKASDNMRSVQTALADHGATYGLDRLHRVAQYLAQILHESGNFRYDREIWGDTPAQKGYEGRKDLGNTQPGDGKKFAGRTGGQITGRTNYERFYEWCQLQGFNPPDFVAKPDLLNTDPWEGLGFIWYWSIGNPTHKSLNVYADEGDIEQITKKVNGGLNGFADRLEKYTRVALVLLGYDPKDVKGFQRWAQKEGLLPNDVVGKPTQIDGDVGPKTRSALHMALVQADGVRSAASPAVKAAPVTAEVTVEVPTPVPVAPKAAEKTGSTWAAAVAGFLGPQIGSFFTTDIWTKLLFFGVGAVAIAFILWRAQDIAKAIKTLREQFG